VQDIAAAFANLAQVETVALAGSTTVGQSDSLSDYDLYIYSRQPVDVVFRENLLSPRAKTLNLHRTFWEDEDAWIEADGTKVEIMYRSCDWTEGELAAKLDRCEAWMGYTTAICYNIQHSRVLFDRSGWFKRMQKRLLETYPEALARNIVQKNLPVLGTIIGCYEEQIRAASVRGDLVSLNHRVAAWLASYFDILFAANRSFHPGDKRLLAQLEQLPSAPDSATKDVRTLCTMAGNPERCLSDHLLLMRRRLEDWLKTKKIL